MGGTYVIVVIVVGLGVAVVMGLEVQLVRLDVVVEGRSADGVDGHGDGGQDGRVALVVVLEAGVVVGGVLGRVVPAVVADDEAVAPGQQAGQDAEDLRSARAFIRLRIN